MTDDELFEHLRIDRNIDGAIADRLITLEHPAEARPALAGTGEGE